MRRPLHMTSFLHSSVWVCCRRSEWRSTEPLRIMSTSNFACSGSGTPSRKPFAKSLVTFVFLHAGTVQNIVMLYETTGSLSPRKPVKSSSFSHRYAFSKKEIKHAPTSGAAVLCENAEVFELWTRAALATWRQRKFGSQPAQNKLFFAER